MASSLTRLALSFNRTSTYNVFRQFSAKFRNLSSVATPDIEVSPKIECLVQEITKLTLIEVSELNSVLKTRLNLPDVASVAIGSGSQAAVLDGAEEETVAPRAKTNYTVKLQKYDETNKVSLIKEIKNLLQDMNLVQAKKFIESAPVIVKADVGKEEAEKLKEALIKHGAEVVIE